MVEGEIAEWKVEEGKSYKSGDVLFTAQTDKSVVEFNAIDDGIVRKILKQNHSVCKVGDPIAIVTDEMSEDFQDLLKEFETSTTVAKSEQVKEGSNEPAAAEVSAKPSMSAEPEFTFAPAIESIPTYAPKDYPYATPYAKHLAEQTKKDLRGVQGSGYQGLVTSKDVEKAPSANYVKFRSKVVPDHPSGSFESIPMSAMRKAIGKRLQQSKQFIPHFYVTHIVDTAKLADTRQQLKEFGIDCTINDFILRATALALREHPQINSGFDSKNQAIVLFKTVDISVAVSIPDGLMTPIVRHADFKSIEEISKEVKHLAKKAKDGTLQPQEYQGGSFTLSNLGMFGVDSFMPIINPPQAAILGVAGAIDGKMKLTLAADHRVIDGADAAKFLGTLKKFLENPSILVL
jgi:pyruvate dehydrogenase E2 component (dihydrolipoamide acetyltransferase)